MQSFRDALNPRFVTREKVVQRIGWFLLSLIPIAALLGLLGGGPFSEKTVSASANGARVIATYDRIGRMHSPLRMSFNVFAPGQDADTVRLTIPPGFVDKIDVKELSPQPDSSYVSEAGASYEWSVEDWSRPFSIELKYIANKWLTLKGGFRIEAAGTNLGEVSVSQFLFP